MIISYVLRKCFKADSRYPSFLLKVMFPAKDLPLILTRSADRRQELNVEVVLVLRKLSDGLKEGKTLEMGRSVEQTVGIFLLKVEVSMILLR